MRRGMGARSRSRIATVAGRLLLIAALVMAGSLRAQAGYSTHPPRSPPRDDHTGIYMVGGAIAGLLITAILDRLFNRPLTPPTDSGPPPPPPPGPAPTFTQLPSNPGTLSPRGLSGGSGGGPGGAQALRRGFDLPPPGVTQFVQDEILVDGVIPPQLLQTIAARLGLTVLETVRINLTGHTYHRMRIGSGTVRENLITASQERRFAGGQPIYLFTMAQVAAANSDQYAPAKLNVEGAHKLATGNGVKVALIDSAVDGRHPDLAGAIAQNFNAVNDDAKPQPHGTAMAGAIAARRTMLSIAPSVQLLAVEAFSPNDNSGEGTTINILKGLDWAAAQGARVVNMSFAGPSDPRLRDALKAAANRGMVLIAASGNAGANSPPLYPAADPNVIAVTATDAKDGLFAQAVRGNHVAVAAPGVDILVPAPDGAYQLTTGTSVAAAEVSGVAALLIERNPKLSGKEVRDILMRTARDLGPKGRDRLFGAGLVDAFQAVTAASPAGH